jgi:hypothetical protein
MEASAIHESGHFYFAQTGHSHFAATVKEESTKICVETGKMRVANFVRRTF